MVVASDAGAKESPMSRTPPYQMTRQRTWQLTGISVVLFVVLSWIFGEHLFSPPLWNEADWMAGGEALKSFWAKQVVVPESGPPPITYPWFRNFLQYMLDHGWYSWFAKLIAFGETLVGLALLVGALVGLAAFVGTFMNFN